MKEVRIRQIPVMTAVTICLQLTGANEPVVCRHPVHIDMKEYKEIIERIKAYIAET